MTYNLRNPSTVHLGMCIYRFTFLMTIRKGQSTRGNVSLSERLQWNTSELTLITILNIVRVQDQFSTKVYWYQTKYDTSTSINRLFFMRPNISINYFAEIGWKFGAAVPKPIHFIDESGSFIEWTFLKYRNNNKWNMVAERPSFVKLFDINT